MNKEEVMKLALEALENHTAIKHPQQRHYRDSAIEALRAALAEEALQRLTDVQQDIEAALAEPEQEPFAYYFETYSYEGQKDRWFVACPCDGKLNGKPGMPLYTAPPQRKPLTDEELEVLWDDATDRMEHFCSQYWDFARAIEKAHGIGEKHEIN